MKLAIELALTYPDERLYCGVGSLDFASIGKLHFEKPDYDTFPCLKIAYDCARCGMVACSIMNSANEASVGLYAKSEIGFYDIPALINSALDRFNGEKAESIESILELDIRVSQFVQNYAKRCVC